MTSGQYFDPKGESPAADYIAGQSDDGMRRANTSVEQRSDGEKENNVGDLPRRERTSWSHVAGC